MKSTVFGIVLSVSISLSFWAPVTEANPPIVKVFEGNTRRDVNNKVAAVKEGGQDIEWRKFPDQRGMKEIYGSAMALLHEEDSIYRPTATKNQIILNVGKGMNAIGAILTFGKTVLDLIEENEKSLAKKGPGVSNFKKAFVIVTREAMAQEELDQNELMIKGSNDENSKWFDDLPGPQKDKVESIMNDTAKGIPGSVKKIVADIKNSNTSADKNWDDFVKAVAILDDIMKEAGGKLHVIWLVSNGTDLEMLLKTLYKLGLDFESVLYMLEGVSGAGVMTSDIFHKAHFNLKFSKYVKNEKKIHYLANDISAFKGANGPRGLIVQADETLSVAGLYPYQEDAKFLVVCENTNTSLDMLQVGKNPTVQRERIVAFVKSDPGADFKGSYESIDAFKTALAKCKAHTTIHKMKV